MSDSIVPRRTRIFSGFDLFLLNIGEPQCLQKKIVSGVTSKTLSSSSPEMKVKHSERTLPFVVNALPCTFLHLEQWQ